MFHKLSLYSHLQMSLVQSLTLPKISLVTLGGDNVDSENAVKFEMGDVLKLHSPQT